MKLTEKLIITTILIVILTAFALAQSTSSAGHFQVKGWFNQTNSSWTNNFNGNITAINYVTLEKNITVSRGNAYCLDNLSSCDRKIFYNGTHTIIT